MSAHRTTRGAKDWTQAADGRANSSPEFLRLCGYVESLIRNSAHYLVAGRADSVARLVMAQLVHVHGLRPGKAKP